MKFRLLSNDAYSRIEMSPKPNHKKYDPYGPKFIWMSDMIVIIEPSQKFQELTIIRDKIRDMFDEGNCYIIVDSSHTYHHALIVKFYNEGDNAMFIFYASCGEFNNANSV